MVNSIVSTRPPRLIRLATEASVAVAIILLLVKGAVYFKSQSLAILSTALDSGLDVVASVMNLVAVRIAYSPADDDHHFGHGKAEPLAGLAQTLFMGVSSTLLLVMSVQDLIHPTPIRNIDWGLAVVIGSTLVTLVLVEFQRRVLKSRYSVAVSADRLHYSSDIFLNLGVIASLVLGYYSGIHAIDAIFGIGVAVYMGFGAWRILLESWHNLMDGELPDAARVDITKICMEHPEVMGVRNIRTRSSGSFPHIQLDLEMDGSLTLDRAHAIGEAVEKLLLQNYPEAQIIIHHEPSSG
ncbi:MAG: cation diffusion facilitator family transporter [Candidatus Pacebacteria bacterium]|nr:cation diffusion facilitator family transporter [Candidatus Paceibacterota bacterium]